MSSEKRAQLYQKFFSFTPVLNDMLISTEKSAYLTEQAEEKTANSETTDSTLFTDDEVLKLERLTTDFQDKCVRCGFQGRMHWQVTLHDGTWGLLCDECGHRLIQQQWKAKVTS